MQQKIQLAATEDNDLSYIRIYNSACINPVTCLLHIRQSSHFYDKIRSIGYKQIYIKYSKKQFSPIRYVVLILLTPLVMAAKTGQL